MKVVVVCEYSGVVRDAFLARGISAVSIDLMDSESSRGIHYSTDARTFDYTGFDLAICFPPCTFLAVSGARWFNERRKEQEEALDFVRFLLNLPVSHIALENPVSIISTKIRKPDQIIQPYMFGHPESKKTCLWLKNLPLLQPTSILSLPERGYWDNQTPSGQNKLSPSPTRAKERAKTYQGIADAMAKQWGDFIAGI